MADKKPAAPAAAAAPAAPAGEAKPKLPIIPIVGAAVVSAILAGGIMFFVMPKPAAAPTEEGGQAAADEDAEGEGDGAEPGAETVYIEIKEPLIANLPPGGPAFLQVRVQIGTRGEAGKKAVESHLPAIQSALLAMLRQTTAEELAKPDAMLALQGKALTEVNRVLKRETGKDGTASAVLFTSFVTQ